MSRDCCVALPRGAMGLSAVCDVVFPDHTHYFYAHLMRKSETLSWDITYCLTRTSRVVLSVH